MSMQAINYALTLPVDESGPRLALILIAHHVNWKTGDMFVSQEELAKEVRCNVRTIRRYVDFLLENEFIEREEQRSRDGRRSADRIILTGYLEWQNIIENGGTIRDPKTRGKQADKLTGRDEPTGQIVSSQPDKSCEPTGQQVSGIKEPFSNQKTNHSSANDLVLEVKAAAARPELRLTPSDGSKWQAWLNTMTPADVARAETAGEIFTTAIWPREDAKLLRIPRPPHALTDRSKAMQGN